MRILHFLNQVKLSPDPRSAPASGIVRVALELARIQAREGHEVTVATAGPRSWKATWEGVTLEELLDRRFAVLRWKGQLWDFRHHAALVEKTWTHRYDVVHAHNYGYLKYLRAKVKLMHFHSDPLYAEYNFHPWRPQDFDLVLHTADGLLAVCDYVAQQVAQGIQHRRPVWVVPNGVEMAWYQSDEALSAGTELRGHLGISARATVFLFCGQFEFIKGIGVLAKAFAQLARTRDDVYLVLAGGTNLWGGGHEPRSTGDVPDLFLGSEKVKRRVRLLGLVEQARMPAVYQASDVVVIPSLWKEALSLVALEAAASGKPVIASNIGGLPEAVTSENGLLVEPGDIRGLVDAMQRLVSDIELRREMGRKGMALAKERSWETTWQSLKPFYGLAPAVPRHRHEGQCAEEFNGISIIR
ncbi:MAG: glycosyltransferase family 4 protein [Firmicutes bacterium]|nr:glycosyltransferase family 4 protein [Bacillota bacterium]